MKEESGCEDGEAAEEEMRLDSDCVQIASTKKVLKEFREEMKKKMGKAISEAKEEERESKVSRRDGEGKKMRKMCGREKS